MRYLWRSVLLLVGVFAVAQLAMAVEPTAQGTAGQVKAAATAQAAKAEKKAGTPVIQIDQPDFNFGAAEEGTVVVHKFKVKNAGSADLHITRVRPG